MHGSTTTTILVVDDDAPIVEFVAETLRDEGYTVQIADDAPSALAAQATHAPALILLDVSMPGNGKTLLEHLRSHDHAHIPIILMTATPAIGQQLLLLGATELLSKPFQITELLGCISRHLPLPGADAQQYDDRMR